MCPRSSHCSHILYALTSNPVPPYDLLQVQLGAGGVLWASADGVCVRQQYNVPVLVPLLGALMAAAQPEGGSQPGSQSTDNMFLTDRNNGAGRRDGGR